MKPKGNDENRLGPVNPFVVGNVFIDAAKKLEWIAEDKTERHRQYYITPKGFEEMTKLGMNIERALLYRQPPAEKQQKQQQHQQHQHQQQQQQQQQQRRTSQHAQHRPKDRRRH